jgi:hypothetical protein
MPTSECRLALIVSRAQRIPAWMSAGTPELAHMTFHRRTMPRSCFPIAQRSTTARMLTLGNFYPAIPRIEKPLGYRIAEAIADRGTAAASLTVAKALIAESLDHPSWSNSTALFTPTAFPRPADSEDPPRRGFRRTLNVDAGESITSMLCMERVDPSGSEYQVSGLPPHATARIERADPGSVTLTICTTNDTPDGRYELIVTHVGNPA